MAATKQSQTSNGSLTRQCSDSVFEEWAAEGLIWLPDRGMGFELPLDSVDYGCDYFVKYCEYARTELGIALTKARIELVSRHWAGPLVDVGIGCGQFVEARPGTLGFDINPCAVDWLKRGGHWLDPYVYPPLSISLWDTLEHMPDPSLLIARVREWVFVSLPIFENCEHVMRSKHRRPGEHIWYWTRSGLVAWMEKAGFVCREVCDIETRLGREDILSFAFQRKGTASAGRSGREREHTR